MPQISLSGHQTLASALHWQNPNINHKSQYPGEQRRVEKFKNGSGRTNRKYPIHMVPRNSESNDKEHSKNFQKQ